MSWRAFLMLSMGVFSAALADPPGDDREKFQGGWVVVSTESDGRSVPADSVKARRVRLVFEGDRVVAREGEKSVGLGTFALDPSRTPKTYDRTYPDGSPRQGIYRLEGETLTICLAGLGKERPKAFATKSGDGTSLVVYKRAGP